MVNMRKVEKIREGESYHNHHRRHPVSEVFVFYLIGSPYFIVDYNIPSIHYLHHVYKSTQVKRTANN